MNKKNKKLPISPVACLLLLWLVVLAVYGFAYFIPAQEEMNLLRSDVALKRNEAELFEQYLSNSAPLQKEIDALEQEIDQINDSFINNANVNFVISDAIQRYAVSLSSVTLDNVTTYNGMKALPINLVMQGEPQNVLDFIAHFENSEDGSFVVRNVSFKINAYTTSATIVLYLCTPSV